MQLGLSLGLSARQRGFGYAVAGFNPALAFDFTRDYYRVNGAPAPFASAMTYTGASNKTMVDSDGVLKWAPHNLLLWSEEFDNASWTKVNTTVTANAGVAPDGNITAERVVGDTSANSLYLDVFATGKLTLSCWFKKDVGDGQNVLGLRSQNLGINVLVARADLDTGVITYLHGASGAFLIEVSNGWWFFSITADMPSGTTVARASVGNAGYASTINDASFVWGAHLYRSDLGGMADVPASDRGLATDAKYLPTTGAARYLPRRGHHVYEGGQWVNKGLLLESEARTNLLLNSGTLSTQSATVTAVPHTLHFTGTGTVTLSGVSTAGPLVGTGTGENNRVSLTFTPTAGSLTLTVSGTVTNAQLEAGATLSSHIPTTGATATRAAETLTVAAADLPYSATAMSGASVLAINYADTGTATEQTLFDWRADANNRITITLDTAGANTGKITLSCVKAGVTTSVTTTNQLTPGLNVAGRIAWRVTASQINIALNGTAATAVTNAAGVPVLSAANATLGGMLSRGENRAWSEDIGDAGMAEVTA